MAKPNSSHAAPNVKPGALMAALPPSGTAASTPPTPRPTPDYTTHWANAARMLSF